MLSPSGLDAVSLLCLSKPAGRASFSPPSFFNPFSIQWHRFQRYLFSSSQGLAFHVGFPTCIFHVIPINFFPRCPDLFFHLTSADSSPSPQLHACSLYHSCASLRFSVTSSLRGMMGCKGLVAIGIDSERGHGWFILSAHRVSR